MSLLRSARFVLLVLVLSLVALLPAQAVVPAPDSRPQCRLLDDSALRARMSGAFELALLEACGRFTPGVAGSTARQTPPGAKPSRPLAARVQSAPDVRVNAVDPPEWSTTQSETSIAINETTGTICSTYNDSYHYRVEGLGYCGFSRSTDGGQTFVDGGVMPPGGGGVSRGDPSVVWRQSDGDFYFTCIHETASYGLGLWRSTDDCATFQWVGLAHAGSSDDKEFMAVDNSPTSPYFGRLYVAWTDFGAGGRIRLVYSDNGTTWSAPVNLSSSGASVQGAWPAVAPDGDVYVAWLRWTTGDLMSFEIVRSTNGGASFSAVTNPRSSVVVPRDAGATSNCGRDALNGDIRYLPSPQIVIGPEGCLHVAYSYDPDGYNTGDVVSSYYRRSCDHGTTWGPEVLLNDDGTLTDQFFPNVAVNDDNVVAASWYDRRLDTAGNYFFDRYRTVSYDGGLTWQANERVSDVSSAVYIDPYGSSCYHGDYDQLAIDAGWLYNHWSDDRVFFNGHYDPDIWFERQPLAADFELALVPDAHQVCRPAVVTSTVELSAVGAYTQPVALGDAGLPPGVQTAFAPNPVWPLPGAATYVITVTAGAADGIFAWPVSGSGLSMTHSVTMTLVVSGTAPLSPTLLSPADGAAAVPRHDIVFAWSVLPEAASYRLQVDDDPGLGSPEVDVSGIVSGSYTLAGPLDYNTAYAWRVSAVNGCGLGPWSRVFLFTTERLMYRVYVPLVVRGAR